MTEEVPVKDNLGGNGSTQDEPGIDEVTAHGVRSAHRVPYLIDPELAHTDAMRRLEVLHALQRVVVECRHDTGQMSDAVVRLLSENMGGMAVIMLFTAEKANYRVEAYYDPDPVISAKFAAVLEDVNFIPPSQGWASEVLRTGEPLLLSSLSVQEAESQAVPSFVEFTRDAGIASLVIVPITGQSGTLGAISLTSHSGDLHYTKADQELLMEVGYRMGLAVETFTLIKSLQNELAGRAYAREALAASEDRFLSIFRSAYFGIKVMDLVGSILESNEAFQAMSGYDENELVALHFYDLVHPEDIPHVLESFKSVKMGRQPHARNEHRLVRKDGTEIWVRTTFAGVKKRDGNGGLLSVFGIVENISDQKQAETELRELQQHLQQSIEIERLRLAQNLHDAPLQELYAVIYKLEEVRLKTTDPELVGLLQQSVLEIKKTLEALRSTASELRPPALSRFGLEKAIRSYAEDFKIKHPDLHLQLTLARDGDLLAEPVRLVLFRVFQESLANVVRHAHATEVRVLFSFDAEEARIEIADNGQGFKVPSSWMANVRTRHYGLAGMAERVSAAGGILSIDSSPESSTTVRAVIPCTSEEIDE